MNESGPNVLRSPANPTIKRLIRLRDNRFRRRERRVLVDGWRESARAIEAGLDLCACYLPEVETMIGTDSLQAHDRESVQIVMNAAQRGSLVRMSEPLFQRISYAEANRGVVTEFWEPDRTLARLRISDTALVLVIDAIEKPGNVGAIFRCADAAGVDAVILSSPLCDLHNPNAIRSSLGAVFSVASAVAERGEVAQFLLAKGLQPLAARVESSLPLWSVAMPRPLAIILGSEAEGLGEHWKMLGNEPIAGVRIPMAGQLDSLNVSVSAALLAYEAVRRQSPETR